MIKKQKKINQEDYHPDPRNDIEKFLFERIPVIVKACGLGDIRFNFLTPEGKDLKGAPDGGIFCIKYDPVYKGAYITIAPDACELFKNGELQTISDSLVHEVSHIITHRLYELAKHRHTTQKDIEDAVEETTESIAQIARKLLAKVDPMFKF